MLARSGSLTAPWILNQDLRAAYTGQRLATEISAAGAEVSLRVDQAVY